MNNIILYVFALAAFAQFHFADIHSFTDRNGRIISKRILDWVCPIPFPQFIDRELYLKTLELCRLEVGHIKALFPLLNLLMNTAIDCYSELNKKITNVYPTVLFPLNTKELKDQLTKHKINVEKLANIVKQYKSLKDNEASDYITKDIFQCY